MSEPHDEPPRAIHTIAFLFRLEGVLSVLSIVGALANLRLNLAVGILGLWIAPGLLRGDRTWRAWALVLSSVQTLSMTFVSVMVLLTDAPVHARIPGRTFSDLPSWTMLLLTVPAGLVSTWQWWVLMQPAIRRRFVPDDYVPDSPTPVLRA